MTYVAFVELTDSFLEEFRLVFPCDEYEVDRYGGEYHQTAVS